MPLHDREPHPAAPRPTRLTIMPATMDDWPVISGWAAAEGWNPGLADGPCFLATDPAGFFLGWIAGQPVSAISVVNYDASYAFLGLYLVHPEHRGRGYGYTTWQAALAHAGSRTVGLNGMLAQQPTYERAGFSLAHRTLQHSGQAAATRGFAKGVVPAGQLGAKAIAAYDAAHFPADRPGFVAGWLAAPGHLAFGRVADGRVTGYGVIRPARQHHRIGPLFADTPEDAETLFDTLVTAVGGGSVTIDTPEPNKAAAALAESRGLAPTFETARMYTGEIRQVALDQVFGVTTQELG